MNREQKALEILRTVAQMAAEGKSLTITEDWGFGSVTVIDHKGAHTHVGQDWHQDNEVALTALVDGLYNLLVKGCGLSWAKPPNA